MFFSVGPSGLVGGDFFLRRSIARRVIGGRAGDRVERGGPAVRGASINPPQENHTDSPK